MKWSRSQTVLSKLATVLRVLSWSKHLLILSRRKSIEKKEFYLVAATDGYLSHQLKIATFERTKLSDLKVAPVVRLLPWSKHFKGTSPEGLTGHKARHKHSHRALRQKNPKTSYPSDTFHIVSTSNAVASAPLASWVEKVPTVEVRQTLRGPSTARLAKNARRSAQDDDFGEEIKRGNHSRSSLATLQNRSLLEPLWRLAAGDVAHNVGSQEVQIEVVP